MEHFVRIIFDEDQGDEFLRTFAGAMESTISESLLESENSVSFDRYETSEGHYVYEVALHKELDNNTADAMVERISRAISGDYTIEVSGNGTTLH